MGLHWLLMILEEHCTGTISSHHLSSSLQFYWPYTFATCKLANMYFQLCTMFVDNALRESKNSRYIFNFFPSFLSYTLKSLLFLSLYATLTFMYQFQYIYQEWKILQIVYNYWSFDCRLGRKKTVIGSMAVASAACIAVAFIPTDKGQGIWYQLQFFIVLPHVTLPVPVN